VLAARQAQEAMVIKVIRQAWLAALLSLLLEAAGVVVLLELLLAVLVDQGVVDQTEVQAALALAVKALTAVQVSLLVLLQLLAAVAVDQVR
jgi:DNA-binding winged helix-turn-helix (wHTH) protein